jgi:hypothetical protein
LGHFGVIRRHPFPALMSGLGRFPRRASWPAATVVPGKADAKIPASTKIPY